MRIRPWDLTRIGQLRSVAYGEHDRLFEFEDSDIDIPAREQAELYNEQCKTSYLFDRGYIEVMTHRDGPGYSVIVTLTTLGDRALECLKNHLIWDHEAQAPDYPATLAEWRARLRACTSANANAIKTMAASTHEGLAPLRAELDTIRLNIWERILKGMDRHDDARFREIADLPEPFFTLFKAEALHHRMKIWEPQR